MERRTDTMRCVDDDGGGEVKKSKKEKKARRGHSTDVNDATATPTASTSVNTQSGESTASPERDADSFLIDEWFYFPVDISSEEPLLVEVDIWLYATARADTHLGNVLLRVNPQALLHLRQRQRGSARVADLESPTWFNVMCGDDDDDMRESGAELQLDTTVVSEAEASARPSPFERRSSDGVQRSTSLRRMPVLRAVLKDLTLSPPSSSKGSNTVRAKQLPKRYHRLFAESCPEIADSEELLDALHCALRTKRQKWVLQNGRLFVSQRHLCFVSKVLKRVTCLRIALSDVVSIRADKMRGITIVTEGMHAGTTRLCAFVQPDASLDLLNTLWRAHQSRRGSSRSSSRSVSPSPSVRTGLLASRSDKRDEEDKADEERAQKRRSATIEEQRARLHAMSASPREIVVTPATHDRGDSDAERSSASEASDTSSSASSTADEIESVDVSDVTSGGGDASSTPFGATPESRRAKPIVSFQKGIRVSSAVSRTDEPNTDTDDAADDADEQASEATPQRRQSRDGSGEEFGRRARRRRSQISVTADDAENSIRALTPVARAPENPDQVVFRNLDTGELIEFPDVLTRVDARSGAIEENTPMLTKTFRRWRQRWAGS